MINPKHIEQLAALAAGELSQADESVLRQRLAEDTGLAESWRAISDVVGFLRDEPASVPSPSAVEAAKRLLAEHRASAGVQGLVQDLADGVRRIIATLTLDTRSQPMVAGLRGMGSTMLSYSSEVCDIDMEITPGDGQGSIVRGQIDDADVESAERDWSVCRVEENSGERTELATTSHGAFFMQLTDGEHPIVVRQSGVEVDLGTIRVP